MNILCWFIHEWRMISGILNIHKSHQPRSFGLLYVSLSSYFHIRYHFSTVFHDFCLMFCVFCWVFGNECPKGGVLAQFFCPRILHCPFKKIPWGFTRGGWSGLELTDTYVSHRQLIGFIIIFYCLLFVPIAAYSCQSQECSQWFQRKWKSQDTPLTQYLPILF